MKRNVIALLSTLAMALFFAGPASADNELELSHDGTTWSATLSGTLFDNALRWVPGDARTATFYVRNTSANPGTLNIDILGDHVGTLLDLGDLHIKTEGNNGFSLPVSDGDEHRILLREQIPGSAVVPITITVTFDDVSPNESQRLSTDLRFRLTLIQTIIDSDHPDTDTATDTDTSTGGGTSTNASTKTIIKKVVTVAIPGALPGTGAPEITWIVALGSILLGTGIAVVSRRRTEPADPQGESHVH